MKSVMISIRPKWCEFIASGKKTIEVRKTAPKEVPFKAYIYCTKSGGYILPYDDLSDIYNGKVIGEFICDKIEKFDVPHLVFQKEPDKRITKESCLTYYELHRYAYVHRYAYHIPLYGWHISDLKIYDKPKALREFKSANRRCALTRAPQSSMYVEVEE